MPNKNCLEGLRCPECKQEDVLEIMGTTLFRVVDDGTDSHTDVEWDCNSYTRCPQCNFEGTLKDFNIHEQPSEEKKKYVVIAFVRKRFTTIIDAVSKDDALRAASDLVHVEGIDIEDTWEEDNEYYDAEVSNQADLLPEGS